MDEGIPMNSGCFEPVSVTAPVGCLVNAISPAAVAGGNVETSQRIVDTAFGALAQALPGRFVEQGLIPDAVYSDSLCFGIRN